MSWADDPDLNAMLTPAQLEAVLLVREAALKLKCRTMADSRVMTAGNVLPLFIKERGLEWAKDECQQILLCTVGEDEPKRNYRRAVQTLLKLI